MKIDIFIKEKVFLYGDFGIFIIVGIWEVQSGLKLLVYLLDFLELQSMAVLATQPSLASLAPSTLALLTASV